MFIMLHTSIENWRLYHTLYYDIVKRQIQSHHEQNTYHHWQPQRQHPKCHIASRDVMWRFLEIRDGYCYWPPAVWPQIYKPKSRRIGSIWHPVAPPMRRNEETYSCGFDPECRARLNPQTGRNIPEVSYSRVDDAWNTLPLRSTQFSTLPRRWQNIHLHALLIVTMTCYVFETYATYKPFVYVLFSFYFYSWVYSSHIFCDYTRVSCLHLDYPVHYQLYKDFS